MQNQYGCRATAANGQGSQPGFKPTAQTSTSFSAHPNRNAVVWRRARAESGLSSRRTRGHDGRFENIERTTFRQIHDGAGSDCSELRLEGASVKPQNANGCNESIGAAGINSHDGRINLFLYTHTDTHTLRQNTIIFLYSPMYPE